VKHMIDVILPNFTVFDHKYKKILANDQKLEYELHKVVNSVRNQLTIYRSLSEYILDKKPIPETSSTFDFLWNETFSSYWTILQTIVFFSFHW